jgi:ribosomal protein S18 acetylase RimI-like enzyme
VRPATLEIVALRPSLREALVELFAAIERDGDARRFHPHPFTEAEAERRCRYQGQDEYYAVLQGSRIVGYGMLRGWDEGYSVPSLGILVRAEARGQGIGKLLMEHLHLTARLRGASRIRLKVYADNHVARRLYERLGYVFEAIEVDQIVGSLNLAGRREPPA